MINIKSHLYELKLKSYYYIISLFVTFLTSYFFSPNLINILSHPLLEFLTNDDFDFISTSIFEVFITYCNLALYSCCFLNIPLGLYFSLTFVKSGLFEYEKKMLLFCLKSFTCIIVLSSFFSYHIIFPLILTFFLSLDLIVETSFVFLKMEIKICDYITFLCKSLFFYCFIIFQIPLLFLVFSYLRQPLPQYMINKRKLWIFFSIIVGCLFSSPDLLSLFMISSPFLLSFEIFVFFLMLKYNYKKV